MIVFRREAADQAAACTDDLQATGEVDGCATWKRIVTAIEWLQEVRPVEGDVVQASVVLAKLERPPVSLQEAVSTHPRALSVEVIPAPSNASPPIDPPL
jgi:hypothetical protein